jgi:hypothetical protein
MVSLSSRSEPADVTPNRHGVARRPGPRFVGKWNAGLWSAVLAALMAGCASREPAPDVVELRPSEARALIARALPANTPDRNGWAVDIYAAFASLRIPATAENFCAAIAVAEQESGLRVDPPVPGLGAVAWKEIERQADRAGVPLLLVRGALQLSSPNGKTYAERIDAAKTEQDLSRAFEDFIDMVPMGRRLFAGYNPVRTAGPMQVSIAFAEKHAAAKPYPYPMDGSSIRREIFTRRGGMYFGIAHLLDYPAHYDKPLYRFADFNAGHYASRNAGFQNAVSVASGIPLALDGDLVRIKDASAKGAGETELAARVVASRVGISDSAVRRALEQGGSEDFERTELYRRVFAVAEGLERRALPRAVLPQIALQSPKITRKLTTEWFANRVDERHRRCLARAGAAAADG